MNKKLTKTEIMQLVANGQHREAFEHSELGLFDITAMRERAKTHGKLVEIDIACVANFVIENRPYDRDRMRSLTVEQINDPILYVHLPNDPQGADTHLLVDGAHRAIRRAHLGLPTVHAYILTEADIIRPDFNVFGFGPHFGIEWGETLAEFTARKGQQ